MYLIPSHRAQRPSRKTMKWFYEPEVREDWGDKVSSRHNRTEIFSRAWGGPHRPGPLTEKLLMVNDVWGRESWFSLRVSL